MTMRQVDFDRLQNQFVWTDTRQPLSADQCEALGLDPTGRKGAPAWSDPTVRRAVVAWVANNPQLWGEADRPADDDPVSWEGTTPTGEPIKVIDTNDPPEA